MSWFKLDDQFPNHPKVRKAGDAAAWLYVCGGCYCAQYLTDGLIPKVVVPALTGIRKPLEQAQKLVEFGLWHDRGDDYEVHDYLVYNPTREKVVAERDAAAARRKKGGRRSADVRANETNPVPVPDVLSEQPSGGASNDAPGDVQNLVAGFVDDWRIVHTEHDPPREFRASCGAAIKKALKNGETPDDIAVCLGVCAKESKNPSALPYVLADMHAGRERRVR